MKHSLNAPGAGRRLLTCAALAVLVACSGDPTEPPAEIDVVDGIVRGVVLATDGVPIEGARVRVSPHYGSSFAVEPAAGVVTNLEGRYEIRVQAPANPVGSVRSDVAVEQTSATEYFRDTLISDLRVRVASPAAVNLLDVQVDGRPSAVD